MKKIILLTAASLLMVGCGTRTVVVEQTATTAPSYSEPQEEAPAYNKDDLYVSIVRDEYPSVLRDMGEAWVVEFGGIVCNAIDNGLTVSGLAQIAVSSGADVETIGFLTGAAIPIYCPHNKWFINSVS